MRGFNRDKEGHLVEKEGLYSEGIVIVRDLIARDHCTIIAILSGTQGILDFVTEQNIIHILSMFHKF